MSEHRWTKFWWQDWQRDPALRMCSSGARGVWMDMLCIMSDADPHGHFLVNGRSPSDRQLASVVGCAEKEARGYIKEMEEAGVFSRTPEGVIFNRRMVRDKAISEEASRNGKRGGNPALKAHDKKDDKPPGNGGGISDGVNPPPYTLESESESESESEREERPPSLRSGPPPPKKSVAKIGERLPDDWQPSPEDEAFAASLGLSAPVVAGGFGDYWHALPGPRARKLDWPATWRGWCRREAERLPKARAAPVRVDRHDASMAEMFDVLGCSDELPVIHRAMMQ